MREKQRNSLPLRRFGKVIIQTPRLLKQPLGVWKSDGTLFSLRV